MQSAPRYIVQEQVAATVAKSIDADLPTLRQHKKGFLMESLGRRQKLCQVRGAVNAAAVMLEILQRQKLQGLQLITQGDSGKRRDPRTLQSAVLSAISRVAASEGNDRVSSTQYSSYRPLNDQRQRFVLDRSVAQQSVAAGTILEGRLLSASDEAPRMPRGSDPLQGTAVISGGLGGLGLLSAVWMAEQGCRSVALLGRSGRADIGHSCILNATAVVTISRCDVCVSTEAADLFTPGKISQMIHAGGVLRDMLLTKMTVSPIREVLAPKAAGLDTLSHYRSLCGAKYTLFSSIAGVLGSAGQGNYAAANSYMDSWAGQAENEVSPAKPLLPRRQNLQSSWSGISVTS